MRVGAEELATLRATRYGKEFGVQAATAWSETFEDGTVVDVLRVEPGKVGEGT